MTNSQSPKGYELPHNVENAAKLLDEEMPGWHNQIDLDRFSIYYADKCILCQLYGNAYKGFELLFGIKRDEIESWGAFGVYTLQWQNAILMRRLEDNYRLAAKEVYNAD